MNPTRTICIYREIKGKEYELEVEISGEYTAGSIEFAPEYPEARVEGVCSLDGKTLPASEWESHGITEEIIHEAEEEALEKMDKDK